ncbi:MAG TPA: hypothetical protein GXX67_12505 [Petrimonas sp.]|nr:hypothetical protein [Petrimonas sp.]
MTTIKKINLALNRMRQKGYGNHPAYKNLKRKRNAIANGAEYKIHNVAPELIGGFGALVCSLNPYWGGKYAGDDVVKKGIERGRSFKY